MKRKGIILLFITLSFLACVQTARAGFGISPPSVRTHKPVFPGSHFEQKITLLRSAADEELMANITINAPEIEDWITIDKGFEFELPKGNTRVPMVVIVDIPKDAEIGSYFGYMNVKVAPKQRDGRGGVAIALGARIEIELNITNEPFLEFNVRKVSISDLSTLGKPWNWKIFMGLFDKFFYKIKVPMRIENTGNVKVAPTKVQLDIYDRLEKQKLETLTDTSIDKVDPFTTDIVSAVFPTRLPPRAYWGMVRIYKDKEIIRKDKLLFNIKVYSGDGIDTSLGVWPWIMLSVIGLIAALIIFFLVKIKSWNHLFSLLYIISWPLRFVWKKIVIIKNIIKLKFWKWMHKKSASYQGVSGAGDNHEKEKNKGEDKIIRLK